MKKPKNDKKLRLEALEKEYGYHRRVYEDRLSLERKMTEEANPFLKGLGHLIENRVIKEQSFEEVYTLGIKRRVKSKKDGKVRLKHFKGMEAVRRKIKSYERYVDKSKSKETFINNVQTAMSKTGYNRSQIKRVIDVIKSKTPTQLGWLIRKNDAVIQFPYIYEANTHSYEDKTIEIINAFNDEVPEQYNY